MRGIREEAWPHRGCLLFWWIGPLFLIGRWRVRTHTLTGIKCDTYCIMWSLMRAPSMHSALTECYCINQQSRHQKLQYTFPDELRSGSGNFAVLSRTKGSFCKKVGLVSLKDSSDWREPDYLSDWLKLTRFPNMNQVHQFFHPQAFDNHLVGKKLWEFWSNFEDSCNVTRYHTQSTSC